MCGIAGVIHRGGPADIGTELTRMLQSMRHRGPDSTGFALYGPPGDLLVMRVKLADPTESAGQHSADSHRADSHRADLHRAERIARRRKQLATRLHAIGAAVEEIRDDQEHACRVTFRFDADGDLKQLTDVIEDIPGCEVLSLGNSLEIVKDLGDAVTVADMYKLGGFSGTHAIGHVRMATESDVDIAGAHPYWAYPFADVAVVHNGQLTNYHRWRRRLERSGHRFQSDCDSEIIAVYLARLMADGASLETAMKQSLNDLDGVFTYLVVTKDALGMAKDEMSAKPLVLYESDDLVAMASEEIAIRALIDHEIDTHDPYEREVLVWTR
jgi:glutamate synthase domain-containing protein 1